MKPDLRRIAKRFPARFSLNDLHIGDRVRATHESWGGDTVPVGSIGSVAQTRLLAVAFDHDVIGDGTGVWAMMEHQVEFIEPLPLRLARRVAVKRGWLASPRMWECRPGWDRTVDHPDPAVSGKAKSQGADRTGPGRRGAAA